MTHADPPKSGTSNEKAGPGKWWAIAIPVVALLLGVGLIAFSVWRVLTPFESAGGFVKCGNGFNAPSPSAASMGFKVEVTEAGYREMRDWTPSMVGAELGAAANECADERQTRTIMSVLLGGVAVMLLGRFVIWRHRRA